MLIQQWFQTGREALLSCHVLTNLNVCSMLTPLRLQATGCLTTNVFCFLIGSINIKPLSVLGIGSPECNLKLNCAYYMGEIAMNIKKVILSLSVTVIQRHMVI